MSPHLLCTLEKKIIGRKQYRRRKQKKTETAIIMGHLSWSSRSSMK